MDIYLVRHGQTDGNVAMRHQHHDIGLNEVGKIQASSVADTLKKLDPTHLITSTNKRAIETSMYIAAVTDLIPDTHPAFEELKRPTFLVGKRLYEIVSLKFVWGWFFDLKTPIMHDGESYKDFRERIIAARTHLSTLPDSSRVVIVSHSIFINFFLEHLNNDGHMGIRRAAVRFLSIFKLKNAGVTHLKYKDGKWRIVERF